MVGCWSRDGVGEYSGVSEGVLIGSEGMFASGEGVLVGGDDGVAATSGAAGRQPLRNMIKIDQIKNRKVRFIVSIGSISSSTGFSLVLVTALLERDFPPG